MQGIMSPVKKALQLNLDASIYGTFAEIGAGQETARFFFQAGRASQTIAKTMSAYDMTFSDKIYGREESGRYVCESRLLRMLDHEFGLLRERLNETRGSESCFFAFANTVAAKTTKNRNAHGWLGVRFQMRPGGPPNDLVIHVRLLDERRLHQQQALGIIGVNMIHSCFRRLEYHDDIVPSLFENLEAGRAEIDMIRVKGPDVRDINNRLLSLDLVRHELTKAVIFSADGQVLQPSEVMYRRPLFIQRGTFRPVTKTNMDIQSSGLKQFLEEPEVKDLKPLVMMEMTLQNLAFEGNVDHQDFLDRVDTLGALGMEVLISDCFRFYELKHFLRHHTDKMIGMVIGASHLDSLFDPSFYTDLEGGLLQAMGRLFDERTRLYVYPFKKQDHLYTAKSFQPEAPTDSLYHYLLAKKDIVDLTGCEDLDDSQDSKKIREMLLSGDPEWESLVPEAARDLIKSKRLFGQR